MSVVVPTVVPETAPTGAVVLDAVAGFLRRFVAYPSEHAHVAHTLWIAHTHLMDAWESTPRIAFLSPEPGSGKTRALEISELLVPNPVEAVNVTPAYLFRKVGDLAGPPTVLFDEIDTVFGPKAKDNEEIRGLLNAGHRRGAVAGRCVVRGKTVETEEIPAYCAVALAGLGSLPDTILSRSVIIRMRRRAPSEQVQPYRRRVYESDGHTVRACVAAWASAVRDAVSGAWPDMPSTITDRDADVWEPLLAVADAAGGDWPARARDAAVALVADSKAKPVSLGVRLLTDLRAVWGERTAMFTADILVALCKIDEAPWGDLRGEPLTTRRLATLLGEYGIKSTKVKISGQALQGYRREDLWDAWQRYLPARDPGSTEPAEPVEPGCQTPSSDVWRRVPVEVPLAVQVPEPTARTEPLATSVTSAVPQVPQVPDLPAHEKATAVTFGCDECGSLSSEIIGARRLCQQHAPQSRTARS